MHLALIIVLLATFAVADAAAETPADAPWSKLVLVAALMTTVLLLAAAVRTRTVRRLRDDFAQRDRWLREYGRMRNVHLAVWVAASLGGVWLADWPQWVRHNAGLAQCVLIDELIILAPALISLVLSWTLLYDVQRAAAGPNQSMQPSRRQFVALHVRHYLGVTMTPIVTLVVVVDVIEGWAPELLNSSWAWAVYAAPLAVTIACFPLLIRNVWATEPLPDGGLRERLQCAARQAGFRMRDILVWKTDDQVVNAAVAGAVGPVRYVFLTDALLNRLTDEQVEAVFAHEIAHVRQHHLALRLLMLPLPFCGLALIRLWWPGAADGAAFALATLGLGPDVQATLLLPIALLASMALLLGWYSRRLELQADLCAATLLETSVLGGRDAAHHYTAALERLALESGTDPQRGSWLHPSIRRRVAFLASAMDDGSVAARFQRNMRRWALLLVVWQPIVFGCHWLSVSQYATGRIADSSALADTQPVAPRPDASP